MTVDDRAAYLLTLTEPLVVLEQQLLERAREHAAETFLLISTSRECSDGRAQRRYERRVLLEGGKRFGQILRTVLRKTDGLNLGARRAAEAGNLGEAEFRRELERLLGSPAAGTA